MHQNQQQILAKSASNQGFLTFRNNINQINLNNTQYNNNNANHRSPSKQPNKDKQNEQTILTPAQQISAAHNQLNSLINTLDFRLKQNYHLKQDQLIQSYKKQLIKAHKDLMQLKNNTNQEQIKNQMNQKAFQLKKQRLQLIQINMFYSNKCLQYKKKLEEVTMQGSQLQRELIFLQKQLQNSAAKKVKLMSQIYEKNSIINTNTRRINQNLTPSKRYQNQDQLIVQSQKKTSFLQTIGKKTSFSTHANTQTMRKMKNLNSLSNSKLKPLINNNLNENKQINVEIKKLFNDKLIGQNIQNSKAYRYSFQNSVNNLPLTKLSKINSEQSQEKISSLNSQTEKSQQPQKNQIKTIEKLFLQSVSQIQSKNKSKKQIPLFKGQQFTDLQKKQIMKHFLSKQQVKQYLYSIIFDKIDDQNIFKKKSNKEKVKIYKEDIKPFNLIGSENKDN